MASCGIRTSGSANSSTAPPGSKRATSIDHTEREKPVNSYRLSTELVKLRQAELVAEAARARLARGARRERIHRRHDRWLRRITPQGSSAKRYRKSSTPACPETVVIANRLEQTQVHPHGMDVRDHRPSPETVET